MRSSFWGAAFAEHATAATRVSPRRVPLRFVLMYRGVVGRQWSLKLLVCALALGAPAAAVAQVTPAVEITAPVALQPLEVPYPEGAHGDAEVDLELLIAADGTVAESSLRSGIAPFAEAARRRAESFRFSPALRNGIPVRARIAARILFREPKPTPQTADSGLAPTHPAATPTRTSPGRQAQSSAATATATATAPVELLVIGEQRTDPGSLHIPREEARRVPGAFGDPFRVVEALPGVAPVLSGLPYYYVRGAPPGNVGYFIDGVRVPLLFHVGPGPSVISPLLIDRVDLFPGAFPARFGRYGSAVLAGETTSPAERSRAEGQARIFDASALVEQPFAEGRGAVALGGRYSYMQAILSAVAPDYELSYGDYQARLAYSVSTQDRLSVFAFGGFDFLRNDAEGTTLFDVAFHRADMRWDRLWTSGRARVALTLSSDSVLSAPDDPGAPGTRKVSRGVRLRMEAEQELATALRLRMGADASAERVEAEREQVRDQARKYANRTDLASGAYADLVWRPIRGVEIVPGVRIDLQRSREEDFTFFEPRLGVRTRVASGIAYFAGFGLAHQLPAAAIRVPGRRPSELELSEQEAVHASQGLEYALPDGMLGRTTVFYQHLDPNVEGTYGRSYGVEQFFRRDFTRRLGGFLSYTLSRAEGAAGAYEALSSYDRTHVLSAVLGYDLGNGFRLGARGYFASGRAVAVACPTPTCGPGDPQAPRTHVRRLRAPHFFRLDARFEKRWTFPSGLWITGTLEWFNALMASEVEGVDWTPRGLVENEQSPLTLPSIGIELGW